MDSCPRCKLKLRKFNVDGNFFWDCPLCSGRAVSMDVVRKFVPLTIVKELWNRAYSSTEVSDAICPVCNKNMTGVVLQVEDRIEEIDVCKSCRFVWFDPQEFQKLPKIVPELPIESKIPPDARKALALAQIESIKNNYEFQEMYSSTPDYWWEYALGLLGVPVEYNNAKTNNTPIVTWALAAIMVIVAIMTFSNLEAVTQNWALIPGDFARHYGLTFISSFLLHGGIIHLIGNLYFLLVFGDNVEDVLGINKYLVLIFLSAFIGDIAHILIDPRSATPVIGASGGISGILAYYCLSFPKAKIGFLWWFRWYRIPVGWMFFFWVVGQFVGVMKQVSGFGSVSSLAHLGGAIVGLTYWWFTSDLQRNEVRSSNKALHHESAMPTR